MTFADDNDPVFVSRACVTAFAHWWHSLGGADPISLEPLAELAYPPFVLPADVVSRSENDHFDGHVLALYLVSTGNFVHPVSRRAIRRSETVALDEYLVEHGLDAPQVEHVFTHCASAAGSGPLASSVARLRAEAAVVLQAMHSPVYS